MWFFTSFYHRTLRQIFLTIYQSVQKSCTVQNMDVKKKNNYFQCVITWHSNQTGTLQEAEFCDFSGEEQNPWRGTDYYYQSSQKR